VTQLKSRYKYRVKQKQLHLSLKNQCNCCDPWHLFYSQTGIDATKADQTKIAEADITIAGYWIIPFPGITSIFDEKIKKEFR
jgi:hypothetical protein